MVERVFLGWDRPLLPEAVRELIDRYAHAGVLDLRRVSLVLPGSRPGRRLKELLLEAAGERGLRLVPPRVLTVGRVPELFYEPTGAAASPLAVVQAWAYVLRSEREEVLEGLFGAVPAVDDHLGWSRLAARAVDLHHEVAGGGLRFAEVAAACAADADLLFDDSHRWQLLGGIQHRYESLLGRIGLVDPDLFRRDALAAGPPAPRDPVWLVGVAELPRVSAEILRRTRSTVGAMIHAPIGEAEQFDDVGCPIPERWARRTIPTEAAHLRVADRPSEQAMSVVREISGMGDLSVSDLVVGVADSDLTPALQEWLEAAGVPVHVAAGTKLRASAPYRLLEATAAYLASEGWEEFAGLVRHPDLERWLGGRRGPSGSGVSQLENLDRFFARCLPAALGTREDPGSRPALGPLRRLAGENALLRLVGEHPLHEWPPRILDYLGGIYGVKPLDPHDRSDQAVIAALHLLRGAAIEMQRLPDPLSIGVPAPAAIRIMLDSVAEESIAPEANRAAVELLNWLELPLDDAPNVVIAGVNEGKLPRSESADPFLPDRIRRRLGLPHAAARYARDAFHLEGLIRSRSRLRLVAGRLAASGDPLKPSRLLLTQRGEELATRVMAFVRESDGGGYPLAPFGMAGRDRSAFALPPERSLLVEPPATLVVTDFRRILEDEYRYVLEVAIGRGSGDDEARELDPPSFGDLAHRVLGRFGRSAEIRSSDARAIAARLDQLLDEEARRSHGRETYATVLLQIEHLRIRLGRFAAWQAARVADGWVVRHVEGAEAGPPMASPTGAPLDGSADADDLLPLPESPVVEFDVDGAPVLLRGRIDRIDHHPETGRWAILDYKTGDRAETPEESHRRKRTKEWKDLQLPLYRHLAAALRDSAGAPLLPPGADPELGYIILSRELDRVGCEMADWSAEELEIADEMARFAVRRLRQGVVLFDPARVRAHAEDPLAPLLGLRQLIAAGIDDEGGEEPT